MFKLSYGVMSMPNYGLPEFARPSSVGLIVMQYLTAPLGFLVLCQLFRELMELGNPICEL